MMVKTIMKMMAKTMTVTMQNEDGYDDDGYDVYGNDDWGHNRRGRFHSLRLEPDEVQKRV